MKNQNRFFLPAIGWFIVTTILLTLPLPAVPKENWFIKIPLFDKWIHIGLFIIMVILFCRAFPGKTNFSGKLKYNFVVIGLGCFVYGIVMEFVQKYFVPNRSFDGGDIIADGIGAAIGSLYSIKRFIKK